MSPSLLLPPQHRDLVALTTPETVLLYTRYAYPLTLFVFFLVSLAWWGIKTSFSSPPSPPGVNGIYNGRNRKRNSGSIGADERRGLFSAIAGRFPGGTAAKSKKGTDDKLTPMRRAVFNWLLVGVIVTFVANSANVILRALTNTGWWCGQAYVVSFFFCFATSSILILFEMGGGGEAPS